MNEALRIDRENVYRWMERAGIDTLGELSELSGVHVNTLTHVLQGGAWKSSTVVRLARALDCNPKDLLIAEGFPNPLREPA